MKTIPGIKRLGHGQIHPDFSKEWEVSLSPLSRIRNDAAKEDSVFLFPL